MEEFAGRKNNFRLKPEILRKWIENLGVCEGCENCTSTWVRYIREPCKSCAFNRYSNWHIDHATRWYNKFKDEPDIDEENIVGNGLTGFDEEDRHDWETRTTENYDVEKAQTKTEAKALTELVEKLTDRVSTRTDIEMCPACKTILETDPMASEVDPSWYCPKCKKIVRDLGD